MRYLVTGAFGGIGASIVEHLLRQDHAVIAQDLRVEEALAGKWRNQFGDNLVVKLGDLSHAEVLSDLAQIGELHRVISAHGIGGAGSLAELTANTVDRIMRVNFLSVVELFRATESLLRSSRGSFVVLSSQAGLRGEKFNSAYCAAKFALIGWANAVGMDSANGGVRLRTLCPGAIDAGMFRLVAERQAFDDGLAVEEVVGRRLATISLGRLGHPEEIAGAAVWLGNLATPAPLTVAVNGGDTFF